jgi:hypothetical protein
MTCEKPKLEGDSAECPLCKETQSTFAEYRQHIGYHYQNLALFKLPQLPSSDETKYGGQQKGAAKENFTSGPSSFGRKLTGEGFRKLPLPKRDSLVKYQKEPRELEEELTDA